MGTNAREGFVGFWREYLAWKPKVGLARHLNRFIKAYTNADRLDRLVDFVTSMEGLVLPGENQELSKQFALRIAWLLGITKRERETIFEEARQIYQARSKVVHGQVDATSPKNLRLCQAAEEMNRQLLVHAMRKPDQFNANNLSKLLLGS